jgi:hypothetical protein
MGMFIASVPPFHPIMRPHQPHWYVQVSGYKATSHLLLDKPSSENGPHHVLIAGDDVNANRVCYHS